MLQPVESMCGVLIVLVSLAKMDHFLLDLKIIPLRLTMAVT